MGQRELKEQKVIGKRARLDTNTKQKQIQQSYQGNKAIQRVIGLKVRLMQNKYKYSRAT